MEGSCTVFTFVRIKVSNIRCGIAICCTERPHLVGRVVVDYVTKTGAAGAKVGNP